jgi:hypothetical protein
VVANATVEAVEEYQAGVVPEAQTALIETTTGPPALQAAPPVTEIGSDGIELTVTIYDTYGRQFGLLASGTGFKHA